MKKLLISLFAAALLAGCGGGNALQGNSSSSASSSSGGSTSSVATAATITVVSDSPQLQSEGNVPVNITATVKDANNVVVSGVAVGFSTTSGDLTVTQPITDSKGQAKATLAIGSDPSNRTITVSTTSGSAAGNVQVSVVGTTLSISGSTSLVLGATGSYTATLLNSGSKAIAGKTLSVTSSLGNQITASTLVTDSTGKINFQLRANNAGTDTITVSGLGLTSPQAVAISGQSFQFTTPASGTKINIGPTPTPVTISWSNNGAPSNGQAVNFSITRGTLSASTANTSNGTATVNVSSTVAGPAVISATASGVSAQLDISFVASKPDAISIQASPATVATQGQSTLTATVRDASGNLVEGQQVDFVIATGSGTLTLASALTNVNGQAQTVYVASNIPSGSNGITVSASFPTAGLGYTPSVSSASTKLTVGGQSVFLSLGTGNKIAENANKTIYLQPWSVQAIDSAGNPVSNQEITLTVHSKHYRKGYLSVVGQGWVYAPALNGGNPYTCDNEDLNLNGTLDPSPTDNDLNTDGILQPGDIAVAVPGTVTTGADGSASFTLNYPEDHAKWVEVDLTASTSVAGTESSTHQVFWLVGLAAYYNDTQSSPPGQTSPYGINPCGQKD